MVATTIQLTEGNSEKLKELCLRTGKTLDELLNEAVERLAESEHSAQDWKAALMQAAGLWKDRTDLPDFDQVRRSMDRNVWPR